MKTTIDIVDPIFEELTRRQRVEGKSLGRLVSDLLAKALADTRRGPPPAVPFEWISRPMRARVDLDNPGGPFDAMIEPPR